MPIWSARIAGSTRQRDVVSVTTLAEDGGTLVVQSNFGVVGCLESGTGRVRWFAGYKATNVGGRKLPSDPVIRGGLVYVLPQDGEGLLAFDRWTGRAVEMPASTVAWEDVNRLAGAAEDWLVFEGRQSGALRPLDGRFVALVPEDTPRPGRGALAGGRFYLPAREGLRVFDTATWKLVASRPWPEGGGAGNVAAGRSALAVLGERLELYSAGDALRARFAEDLAARPPRAEGCARLGRILEEAGRVAEAIGAYSKALEGLEKDPGAGERAAELRARIGELREKAGP
jgi:hypothetical protein